MGRDKTNATSYPEIGRGDLFARQIFCRALERHAAFLQTIDAVRGLERLHDVLLDQNDRGAFAQDPAPSPSL